MKRHAFFKRYIHKHRQHYSFHALFRFAAKSHSRINVVGVFPYFLKKGWLLRFMQFSRRHVNPDYLISNGKIGMGKAGIYHLKSGEEGGEDIRERSSKKEAQLKD